MEIKVNRGVKAPKRVHQVNVSNSMHVTLRPIFAGGDPWESSKVFGCGNPRSTGSTGGEKVLLSRHNISKFVVAGTA
jgi:hypothetical protein